MPSMPQNPKRGEPSTPCKQYPLRLFFPDTESTAATNPNKHERDALNVCASCPLAARRRCLTEALVFPISHQYGVVGGATAAQRRAIIRGRQAERLAGVA